MSVGYEVGGYTVEGLPQVAVSSDSFSWWGRLRECMPGYEVVSLPGVDAGRVVGLVLGTTPVVNAEFLSSLPNLEVVSKFGVGVENVDFAACEDRGVVVWSESGLNRWSVAEHVLSLVLQLTRRGPESSEACRGGSWFKPHGPELRELSVGVVGVGSIGSAVAELFDGLGCEVYGHDLRPVKCEHAEMVELPDLLMRSDVVTIHIDGRAENRGFCNRGFFMLMADGSWFVNTSRGSVVDEAALVSALDHGLIEGAGLDVFAGEPNPGAWVTTHRRVIPTCHMAGTSRAALRRMNESAVDGIVGYFAMAGRAN